MLASCLAAAMMRPCCGGTEHLSTSTCLQGNTFRDQMQQQAKLAHLASQERDAAIARCGHAWHRIDMAANKDASAQTQGPETHGAWQLLSAQPYLAVQHTMHPSHARAVG